jgi:zinc transport system substrate-binding protein
MSGCLPTDPARHCDRRTLAALAVSLWLLGGCNESVPDQPSSTAGPLSVFAVNYPLAYFAETIGADTVAVSFPAPADVDPAFWQPTPEIVAGYQDADLVLLNGAGYARWISTAPLPRSRQCNTGAAFAERTIAVTDSATHTHGTRGEHSHGEIAFTTWLDLELAAEQVRAVTTALVAALPIHEHELTARSQTLQDELSSLDARLRGLGPGPPMLASHPVYQYLERRYRLELRSLHWEPDVVPDSAAWSELDELLAQQPAAWMLWEGPPLPEVEADLARRGVTVLVYEPCGNRPGSRNLLEVFRNNVESLSRAFDG